jgi:homoserine kinase
VVMHWLAELDGRRISVEVPASSANLGAGYDCIGLALSILDRIDLEVRGWSRGAIELTVEGEGAGELASDRTNRFVLGLEAVLREVRGPLPDGVGWRIDMHNAIPLTRGLGSSAAATVGGVLAGNALLGEPLTTPDLLRIATSIEGHPDNAAAALLGGFTIAARIEDEPDAPIEALRFDAPRELRAVLFIPDMRLSTADMRRALPTKIPLDDAVANIGRVALGVAGLASGRHDLLRALTIDRIHEPYRAKAYPELPLLTAAAREAGAIGACLSGAGSAVLAFADSVSTFTRIEAAFAALAADRDLPGRIEVVSPRNAGARVISRS